MSSEFHDLSEQLLNGDSGETSFWGNLGYWEGAQTYAQACTALADQLGLRLGLTPRTRLLDIGFGCGDQLLLRNTSTSGSGPGSPSSRSWTSPNR